MPNGNVHRKLTKLTLLSSVPLYFFIDPTITTGILTGIYLSLWVNCDNDITTNRLGVYRWLGFDAYNRLIAHRAGLRLSNWRDLGWKDLWKLLFFSHFPITGTLLRFAIVFYLPLILLLAASALQVWLFWYLLGILLGLCLSDGIHILADIIWSALKKTFPFLKRFDDNGYRPYKIKRNLRLRKI